MQHVPLRRKSCSIVAALLLSIVFLISYAENREIRKITPPNLSSSHLGRRILCHRPMRRGAPQMNVELIDQKIVAHNYGHGGSGWTLGPGCAQYVNNLLEQSCLTTDLNKESSVTIVGAGALGLFTAYDLVNRGYKNITIVAEHFDNLTSHNAGGLLAPVSMDNDAQMQKIIDTIGIDAYKFYDAIAHKIHPIFKDGAVVVPTYFKTRQESGLESYVGLVMQPAKDVILDFGTGTTQEMVVYDDGIFIDTAKMMTALTDYLQSHIKFVQKKITYFSEISSTYIINCSGLGGKELNDDSAMVSVQGHLVMLKDQQPQDLQYMILVYFGETKNRSGQKVKRSFYVFPKQLSNTGVNDVGVIGGTFIEGATRETPNNEEFDIMLNNARAFYGVQS